MRVEFGSFLDKIIPFLTKNLQSCEELKSFLERCYPELKPELADTKSISTILKVVEEKCTIINIVMLEAIVSHFKITKAQETIRSYNEIIESFCYEIKLRFMLNKQLTSYTLLTCEKVEFVLDWNPDEYMLNDIRRLLEKAFNELSRRVIVRSVHRGNSIIVICYAPQYLMDSLLLTVQANLTVLINEMQLMLLNVGHYNVYDRKVNKMSILFLCKFNYRKS